jgi:ATP-dependent RNA helicase RhlE
VSFDELNIDPRCLRVLKANRITTPTPVQAQAIPVALEGYDLVAVAQTGTGKTLAFGLPALTRLAREDVRGTRMLVLAPTRELAQQVHDVLDTHARALGLRSACVYGGVGMDRQAQALRAGTAIIVATPGRLIDHMQRGNVNFKQLSILVLDEGDRMLDMGFMPSIERILEEVPKERQTMMFSATFPKEIADLTKRMQRDAVRIQVGAPASPAKDVKQGVYTVHGDKKLGLLASILREPHVTSTLVFLRTKHRTDRIAKALHAEGFKAQAIHSGRTQRQRQQAIDGFRDGRYTVLVATDVAARGLDVHGISHVVNFDVPNSSNDYIHRIGRTGRANATGIALTLVCPEEGRTLREIERDLGNVIPREDWEGAVHIGADSPREERWGNRKRDVAPRNGQRSGQRNSAPRSYEARERSDNGHRNGGRDDNRKGGPRDAHARTAAPAAKTQYDRVFKGDRASNFLDRHEGKADHPEGPHERTDRAPHRNGTESRNSQGRNGARHNAPRNAGSREGARTSSRGGYRGRSSR